MKYDSIKKTLVYLLKLCALGALIGVVGGAVGAIFAHLLSFVTATRAAAPWILLLLPLAGIATVWLYRVSHMENYGGTNEIIHCMENEKPIRVMAAPLIFLSTAITHLFGGSAGREGAAIQLGGAGASAIANLFKLKDTERTVFIMNGMSAVFAGVFGTPLTAAFFILEFQLAPKIRALAILPCFIASILAAKTSALMGVAEESVHLGNVAAFSVPTVAKILVLVVGLSLLGKLMCFSFGKAKHVAKKLIANPILRTVLCALLFILLTILVGDMRYSGSGMDLAIGAVEGSADWFDFLLKMLFTSVTLAAGFKGGEIVPTFCIGATFGCVLGSVLGLDTGFAAALGLIGLFCCVTNGPVSAIFLGIEMFGVAAAPYYALVCLVLWPLSVKNGLFQYRACKPVSLPKKKSVV